MIPPRRPPGLAGIFLWVPPYTHGLAAIGVDVALAVDIVRLAGIDDIYDVGVVFSGDTDVLPAIETVLELKCGHIEVAAWRGGGRRLRLDGGGTSRPWCHWLDRADYRAVLDSTNYSHRGPGGKELA